MTIAAPLLDLQLATSGLAPGTAEWWRARFIERIADRELVNEEIERYVNGQHPTAFATSKYREAFGAMMSPLRDDWISVVVEAATERLAVVGLRGPSQDETGDAVAWDIWQANGLDARMPMGFDEAVKFGSAYLVVSPGDTPEDAPVILVLPSSRAVVERDPSRPTERAAGAHMWSEPDGSRHAVVWTREERTEWATGGAATLGAWEVVDRGPNPLGVVPIIPLPNRPSLRSPDGVSDIRDVLPLQDVVNKLACDMVVASEYVAFPQRWSTGLEIPTDPETGKPVGSFISAINRLWTVEDKDIKFGEFSAANLTNYTEPIELVVRHIAAQTRTPPHYLMGNIVNASAEALKAAEAGLVSRVRAKHRTFGEGIEDAIRLAFRIAGDEERAAFAGWETIWQDPETRTEAERVDALTKLASLGVPQEALWAMVPGTTPQVVERWKVMAEGEALRMGLSLNPLGQVPTAPVAPTTPAGDAAAA